MIGGRLGGRTGGDITAGGLLSIAGPPVLRDVASPVALDGGRSRVAVRALCVLFSTGAPAARLLVVIPARVVVGGVMPGGVLLLITLYVPPAPPDEFGVPSSSVVDKSTTPEGGCGGTRSRLAATLSALFPIGAPAARVLTA